MADEFSFDREQRDHLLGAQLSLAYSVYSIPGAMILGLLADLGSRKNLFVCVVALGAFATLCTAHVENYDSLFYLRILRCVYVCVCICVCDCVCMCVWWLWVRLPPSVRPMWRIMIRCFI